MVSSYRPGQEVNNSNKYGVDVSLNPSYQKKMVFPIWSDNKIMEFRVFPAVDEAGNCLPMVSDEGYSEWICPIRLLVRGTGQVSRVSMILNYKSQQAGPYEFFYERLRNLAGYQRKPKNPELLELLDGENATVKRPTPALLFQGVVLQHGDDDMSNYSGVNVLCLSAKSCRERFDRLMMDMADGKAEKRDLVNPSTGWAMRWSAITKQQTVTRDGEVMQINPHYKLALYGPVPVQDPRWFSQWVAWEKLLVESGVDDQLKYMKQVFPIGLLEIGLQGSGFLGDINPTNRSTSIPPMGGAGSIGGVSGIGSIPGAVPPKAAPVAPANPLADFPFDKGMPAAAPGQAVAAPMPPAVMPSVGTPPVMPESVPPAPAPVASVPPAPAPAASGSGPIADEQVAAIMRQIEAARQAASSGKVG